MRIGGNDRPPRFPCLLFDDDGWLIPCESEDDVQLAVEPDFLYDIEAAFDSRGCPLVLTVRDDEWIVPRVAGPPEPDDLAVGVRGFFRAWTDAPAPDLSGGVEQWVPEVIRLVRTTATRRRRREPNDPAGR
ncbi:hypothetical protein FNQ90_03400 [Streptomyces alkaliphilus]|uniref:Uncharacterized protein n=1 Tax=Streptomyces alkaliphilus TaxID=1472722 RepID=A0A7W3TAD2_9ACTN|nr:hypothetical protein [Streptomyces alkaliphilus]MBB0243181.1 hypothetical protein [Streptomyces alkaliphilus]